MTDKGFYAEILTGPRHSPNGGISATRQFVTIIGDNVPEELRIWAPDEKAPAVRMTGWQHRAFVPVENPTDAIIGPMSSGAFVYSSDSRWEDLTGSKGPIPLHDRYETAAQYDALSS